MHFAYNVSVTSFSSSAVPAWAAHLPKGMTVETVDLLRSRSLPGAWVERWAAAPSSPVVFDDREGWVTGGELEARSRIVAGRFVRSGLRAGDRILMSADASVALVVAHVAALRLGLVVVPANTSYLEREIAHLVFDATPAAALVDSDERGRWVTDAAGERDVLVVGTEVDLPDGSVKDELDRAQPDDPAMLVYTSGTTGSPKGALLSHGNLLASVEALRLAWRWTTEDRLVLPLPLFHMHGLGVGLHGTLAAGASVVLRSAFDVGDVLSAVDQHRATLFFGVPTIWSRFAASGRVGELSGLRLGVSGSAPLDASLHAEIAASSGLRLIERYGMTETLMNTSNPYNGDRRPGTVGLPLPGVEVRLAEATDEILLRGPNVFSGYWTRPDATAESFRDGWFATGDVGAFDGDGYLRIVGRRRELIISGGYNVYPREIEDVLRSHPRVNDVAVVGLPNLEWGEQVVAVIEGPGSSEIEADLAAVAHDQLAAYKRPKRYVFVNALPRNALGKVVKAELVTRLKA